MFYILFLKYVENINIYIHQEHRFKLYDENLRIKMYEILKRVNVY